MDDNRRNLEDWLEAVDVSTYYELLGVLEVADEGAIQEAFHRFSAAFHPDQHRGEDERTRQRITYVFKRGAEAYRVLRDPELRARYDLCLAQGKLRLDGQPSTPGAQSLADLCTTPGGRLHARRAEEHLDRSELADALRSLERALDAEGDNPRIVERQRALLDLLRLQGG